MIDWSEARCSKRTGISTAVDEPVLARNVARVRAAQESARLAELFGLPEPLRGNAGGTLAPRLVDADPFRLSLRAQRGSNAIGIEQARQQVVDRHVVLRHLARNARDETREPRACSVREAQHV